MTWLGRAFNLRPKLTTLLAVGSSICGVSAIIATKGAIDADDEDSSFAIAAILALGALALFIFPLIGHALHLSDQAYGLWSGLAVDNTAEATAAGALYSDAAGKISRPGQDHPQRHDRFRSSRLRHLLGPPGPGPIRHQQSRLPLAKISQIRSGLSLNLDPLHLPLLLQRPDTSLANLSRWAFLLTFAGVGLRTNFREMRKQGLRPFAVGAIGEVAIAFFTLLLVVAADRLFHL